MKVELDEFDRKLWARDEKGRAYLEYNDKVGGEPLLLIQPSGYPPGVKEHGGVIAVYKECIEKGVTWEKLLNYKEPSKDTIL